MHYNYINNNANTSVSIISSGTKLTCLHSHLQSAHLHLLWKRFIQCICGLILYWTSTVWSNFSVPSSMNTCSTQIRNYDSSSYIGIDPGREYHFLKTLPAYNSRTKKSALCSYRTRRQRRSFRCFVPVFELFASRKQTGSCFTSSPGQFFSFVVV